jgi:diguanylate cyclase (GGDEF)-like protein
LGVVSFDLSNFKALNDVFGHDAGDEALRIISKAIQEELRLKPDPSRGRPPSGLDTVGIASRPGGDEFAAILRKVGDTPAAMAAIARIEARVQKDLDAAGLGKINTKGGTRFVSIVGGVELRKAKDVRSLEDLLSAADQHSIARKGEIKQSRAEPSGRFDVSETEGVAQEGPRVKPGQPKEAPPAPPADQGRIAALRAALMKASPTKLEQIREKALKGPPEAVKIFEDVYRDVVRERGLGDLLGDGAEPAVGARVTAEVAEKMRDANDAVRYTPGAPLHGTGLDNAAKIVKDGLKPTKGRYEDGVFVVRAGSDGVDPGTRNYQATFGSDGQVPVVFEFKSDLDILPGENLGEYVVRGTESGGILTPDKIEAVIVAGKRYSLDEFKAKFLPAETAAPEPNQVYAMIRGRDGEVLRVEKRPYDGSEADAIRVARSIRDEIASDPEVSNINTLTGATGPDGKARWAIPPNGSKVAAAGSEEAAYIGGRLPPNSSEIPNSSTPDQPQEPANVPDAPSEPAPAPEADQPAAPAPERPAGGPEAGGEPEKPYPGIPVRTPAPGFVPAGRPIAELIEGQKFTREGSREPLTVTRAEDGESVVYYRFPNGRTGQISILAQGEVTGSPPDIDAAGFVGPDVEIGTLEVGTKFGARGGQWEVTEHVQGKRSKDDMVRAKNLKDGGLELFDSDQTTEAPTPEERRATAKRDREAADAATEASRAPGGGADLSPERPASVVDTQDFEAEHAPAGGLFDSATDATVTGPPPSAGRVQKIVKARAAAVRAGKAYDGNDSPHALIRDLVNQLEIAAVGDRANYRSLKPGGGALGFYQAFSEGIRLRYQDDVPTAVHEIGHALHKAMFPQTTAHKNPMRGLSPKVFPKAWQKDLVRLGRRLYGSQKPNSGYASEGWAEAIRMLVVEPDVLKSLAPNLYEGVVRKMVREHPGVWWSLRDAGGRWKGLKVAGAENPIRQMIRREPPARSSLIDRFDDMRTLLYDRLQRVVRMKKDMGVNPPAHLDPEIQMRRAQGIARGQFDNVLEFGIFDPADPNRIVGPSLESIVKPLHQAGKLELWEDWMVAKRTIEKRAQGIETMGTIASQDLVDFVQRIDAANPEFRKAAADFQQINEWLVQTYAVGHGLISSDVANKIVGANLHYITFRHARTDTAAPKSRQFGKGYVNQKAGLGRFRGGEGEQIFPPLETFMVNMKGVMTRAQLNRAGQLLARTFWETEGMARWIEKVARPMDAFKIEGADLSERILKQLGVDPQNGIIPQWIDDADKASGGQLLTALSMLNDELIFTPGFRVDRATRQFTILREGKPEFYQVKDDRLFDVLEGLHNMSNMSALARFLHLPAMVLKMGATQLNPEFFIPNFIRDTFQALTMSERGMKDLPRDVGARLRGARAAIMSGELADLVGVSGIKRNAADAETIRLARESGAFFAGEFDEYLNNKTGRVDFDGMFAPKSIIRKFWGKPWRGQAVKDLLKLGPVARINNQIEMATRLGEFRAVLEANRRRGVGEREAIAAAGQAASDVTLDWTRGGTLSRDVNFVSAFFNAAMLGTDKLARFIKQNPTKAATAIFTYIMAPSIATHFLNRDDEQYWQLPYQERDRHWHIPTGLDEKGQQHWIKVPKPYGVGLFGTAVQRSLARLDGIDPVSGKKGGDPRALQGLHRSLVEELTPLTLTKDNIPLINIVGLQPLLEVAANHSFHFDEPIIRPWEAGLPYDEQGADRASRLAVALGQAMDYPPRKIDYLVRGFTGGLGRTVTQSVIDPMIGAVAPDTRVAPNDPIGPEDWLVVRRFIEGEAKTDAEVVTRFFEQWEQVERRHRGLGARKASGQDTSAYADAHQAEIELYKAMQPYRAEISDRFAELRRLYRDRDIPADQLEAQIRDQIDQIQLQARRGLMNTAQEPTK